MGTLAATMPGSPEVGITKASLRGSAAGGRRISAIPNKSATGNAPASATRGDATALFHSPAATAQPSSRTSTSDSTRRRRGSTMNRATTEEDEDEDEASGSLISLEDENSDFEEDDDAQVQQTPAHTRAPRKLSKDAKKARRREQNRKAQRALRERKESRLQELEVLLQKQKRKQAEVEAQKEGLQKMVSQLQLENAALRKAVGGINERSSSNSSSDSPKLTKTTSPSAGKTNHRRSEGAIGVGSSTDFDSVTRRTSAPGHSTASHEGTSADAQLEQRCNTATSRLHARAAKAGLLPVGEAKLQLGSTSTSPADLETLTAASNLCNLPSAIRTARKHLHHEVDISSPGQVDPQMQAEAKRLRVNANRTNQSFNSDSIGAGFRSLRQTAGPVAVSLATPTAIDCNVLGLFPSSEDNKLSNMNNKNALTQGYLPNGLISVSSGFMQQNDDEESQCQRDTFTASQAQRKLQSSTFAQPGTPLETVKIRAGHPFDLSQPFDLSPSIDDFSQQHHDADRKGQSAELCRSSTFTSAASDDSGVLTPSELQALSVAQRNITQQRKSSLAFSNTSSWEAFAHTLFPKRDEPMMAGEMMPPVTSSAVFSIATTPSDEGGMSASVPLRNSIGRNSGHPRYVPSLPHPGNADLRPDGEESYAGFAYRHAYHDNDTHSVVSK